jgi:hypothetical protein
VLGEAYEQLRDAVLSSSPGGWRLGHGVLCARGMTAWMTAVGELAPARPAGRASGAAGVASMFASATYEPASAARTGVLPDADQVVAVLTQMVLPLAA